MTANQLGNAADSPSYGVNRGSLPSTTHACPVWVNMNLCWRLADDPRGERGHREGKSLSGLLFLNQKRPSLGQT